MCKLKKMTIEKVVMDEQVFELFEFHMGFVGIGFIATAPIKRSICRELNIIISPSILPKYYKER